MRIATQILLITFKICADAGQLKEVQVLYSNVDMKEGGIIQNLLLGDRGF